MKNLSVPPKHLIKKQLISRIIMAVFCLIGVYIETGWCTTLFALLMFIGSEFQTDINFKLIRKLYN